MQRPCRRRGALRLVRDRHTPTLSDLSDFECKEGLALATQTRVAARAAAQALAWLLSAKRFGYGGTAAAPASPVTLADPDRSTTIPTSRDKVAKWTLQVVSLVVALCVAALKLAGRRNVAETPSRAPYVQQGAESARDGFYEWRGVAMSERKVPAENRL